MSEDISRAILFFKNLHKDQKRKDNVRPYFVHLEDVARRVSQVTDDEDIIIAAYGHDAVEDQPITVEEIKTQFGPIVAYLINELTDKFTKSAYPELNRAKRKQLERERYAQMPYAARLIKLADIASNLNDKGEVLEDGKPEIGFDRMFTREKELCLPYLITDTPAHRTLYAEAAALLAQHRAKYRY